MKIRDGFITTPSFINLTATDSPGTEMIGLLARMANQPEFQEIFQDEERVRTLNILGKGSVYDVGSAEAAARDLVVQLSESLEKAGKDGVLLHECYEVCSDRDNLSQTLCAMANAQGGVVEVAEGLQSEFDSLFVQSPFLGAPDQPMLLPLHGEGHRVILVGRAVKTCFTRDGKAYRRNGRSNELFPEFGKGLSYHKNARPNELCLNIHEQASVLAELFNGSEQEFCFALFGQWGRGKTELAKQLQSSLTEKGYQTIWFSAWRHPATPELWAHLYETFVEYARHHTILWGFPVILRTAILRNGLWLAIWLITLLGFYWANLGQKWEVVTLLWSYLWPFVGISGIFLIKRMVGTQALMQRLLDRYGRLPSHQEKLGLQSAIGKDLGALLSGWLPFDLIGFSGWGKFFALLAYGLVGYGVAGILFPNGCMEHPNLQCSVFIFWNLFLVVSVLLPFLGRKAKRILLVVDDLDRCAPEIMLNVMASLKLLLEVDEIQNRLQVLMLVDERILRRVILQNHGLLLDNKNQTSSFDADLIVRENFEKLFTGHFRLLPLTGMEIGEVAEKLMQSPQEEQSQRVPIMPTTAKPATPPGNQSENETATNSPPPPDAVTTKSILGVYSQEEQEELLRYLRGLKEHGYALTGPRSVRYLFMGYQLARLFVEQTGISFQPAKLVNALTKAHTTPDEQPIDEGEPWDRIARQVSWPGDWGKKQFSTEQTINPDTGS